MRLGLTAAACLVALAACRDECEADTFAPRCEGNVLVTCPTPGVDQLVPVRIRHTDCKDRVCIAPNASTAMCALAATLDPSCLDGGSWTCDGRERVRCAHGYATERAVCKACSFDAGCAGGVGMRCTSADDCAPELGCADAGVSGYRYCR